MSHEIRLDFDLPPGAWAPALSPSALLSSTSNRNDGRRELRFGDFRIPAHLDLLYRNAEVVALEPRAVQVLRTLAESCGEVVSKDSLLDRVWPDTFVCEGVLKKAIFQIRRALERDGEGREWIETFHRRGYRLRTSIPGSYGTKGAATWAAPTGGTRNGGI